jgi:hypothetical protein
MKNKLLQIVLIFLAFNSMQANQTFAIDSKQIKQMTKTNTLYMIGVDKYCNWDKTKVNVKNFKSIGKGFIQYRSSKLDLSTYKKDTAFVVFAKEDEVSMDFMEKLRTLGFKNAKYLKGGQNAWNKILINFRGIKLFSMFNY